MARMNEGFSRVSHHDADRPNWALEPLPVSGQYRPSCSPPEAHWAPCGPGWFDSSWLLSQGLEVTELCSLGLLDGALRALQMQSPPSENVHPAPA
jgi:hypothetical protein